MPITKALTKTTNCACNCTCRAKIGGVRPKKFSGDMCPAATFRFVPATLFAIPLGQSRAVGRIVKAAVEIKELQPMDYQNKNAQFTEKRISNEIRRKNDF